MRGALAAPLLLTTILFVAADSDDDVNISKYPELYPEDASPIFYSNVDTGFMTKSLEESPNLKSPHKRDVVYYADAYHIVDRNDEGSSEDEEKSNPAGPRSRNPFSYVTECYDCVGCNEVSGLSDLKICPITSDISKRNKCIVYVEKYSNADQPWYIRACASDRNTCEEMKEAYSFQKGIVSLVSCEVCEGDRCNDSSRSHSLSFTSVAFFVIIAPLIAKYTLS